MLVALEAIAGGSLFALDADPWLRMAIVATMLVVLVVVTGVVLGIAIYFTVKNPGFLFNPAEVAQLSEAAQQTFFPPANVIALETPLSFPITDTPNPRSPLAIDDTPAP